MVVHALSDELDELQALCLSELLNTLGGELECAVALPMGFAFEDMFCGTRAKILRLKTNFGAFGMLSKVYIYHTFFKSLNCRVVHSHGSVEAALGALLASAGDRSLVKDFYAVSTLGDVFRSVGRRAADVITIAYGERHKSLIEGRGCDGGRVVCIPTAPLRGAKLPLYAPRVGLAAAVCSRREDCAQLTRALSLSPGWRVRIFAPRALWGVISRFAALFSVSDRVTPALPSGISSFSEGCSVLLLPSGAHPSVAALFSSVGIPVALSDASFATGCFVGCDLLFRRDDPFSLSECLSTLSSDERFLPTHRKGTGVIDSGDTAEALLALYRSL